MPDFSFPQKPRFEPPIPALDERLLPDAAAALIGVSPVTLRNWRSQGKGPPYYQVGRVFYTKADIADWIASRRVACR